MLVVRGVFGAYKQLDDSFHLLAENLMAGRDCSYIKKGYRKFPQGNHIIFYTLAEKNKIRIVRILHKNMNIESKFAGQ